MSDTIIERGRWKLVFTDIGEGHCGDYNPNDPEDEPLLRADLYFKGPADLVGAENVSEDGWCDPRDSSYCTLARVGTPKEQLAAAACELFDELDAWATPEAPWHKRIMELWTWRSYTGESAVDVPSWKCNLSSRRPA